jgi:hypothetical protein
LYKSLTNSVTKYSSQNCDDRLKLAFFGHCDQMRYLGMNTIYEHCLWTLHLLYVNMLKNFAKFVRISNKFDEFILKFYGYFWYLELEKSQPSINPSFFFCLSWYILVGYAGLFLIYFFLLKMLFSYSIIPYILVYIFSLFSV